jgi:hypothetical protein
MAVAVVPGACRDGFVGLAAYRSRDGLTADRETPLMLAGQGQGGAGAPLATAAGAPLRFAEILEMGAHDLSRKRRGVGEGIRHGLAANNLNRHDLFIITKLWPYAGATRFFNDEDDAIRWLLEPHEGDP